MMGRHACNSYLYNLLIKLKKIIMSTTTNEIIEKLKSNTLLESAELETQI